MAHDIIFTYNTQKIKAIILIIDESDALFIETYKD